MTLSFRATGGNTPFKAAFEYANAGMLSFNSLDGILFQMFLRDELGLAEELDLNCPEQTATFSAENAYKIYNDAVSDIIAALKIVVNLTNTTEGVNTNSLSSLVYFEIGMTPYSRSNTVWEKLKAYLTPGQITSAEELRSKHQSLWEKVRPMTIC